jgi:hypothetical protein
MQQNKLTQYILFKVFYLGSCFMAMMLTKKEKRRIMERTACARALLLFVLSLLLLLCVATGTGTYCTVSPPLSVIFCRRSRLLLFFLLLYSRASERVLISLSCSASF